MQILKNFRFFIFILPLFSYTQKSYELDYSLAYEANFFRADTISKDRLFLTKYNDNSYYALITKSDSLNYRIIFHDRDSIHADVTMSNEVFNSDVDINIDCKNVSPYKNTNQHLVKNYEYIRLNDTVFNSRIAYVYKLQSNLSKKKIKRKKIGYNIYLIDPSLEFHLPLIEHETAYEEWKRERNFNKGIVIYKTTHDYKGKIVIEQKLTELKKIKRTINILGDCH